ncbi:sodium/myo-inositol cotransporter isoform X2 [Cyclopterus lumpus]|uniref:sodium/myo-inositol cotransporter isoform X2 n=1 Tax=Cyclopterus lumpus TaxID=8103 RepID=UPI0014870864|nr:sodium/myo-inositol cotransporter isoform X2 [Cyclopterus lumpus]
MLYVSFGVPWMKTSHGQASFLARPLHLFGMISRILFADELACIGPEHCMSVCGSQAGCSNLAYPRLVMAVMPVGLRGLMMAVMIAALMSDLDSIFNSASTIFTLDIYKTARSKASQRELLIMGRLFVVLMVVISIAWVPVIIEMQGGQTYLYIQEVAGYLTPPIAALFLLGVFWKRCNEIGAFCGGMTGLALGIVRLVLVFIYRQPRCDQPDDRPAFIVKIHYMYFASGLFWISGFVAVVVSLCTSPPDEEQVRTATFWGLRDVETVPTKDRKNIYRLTEKSHCSADNGLHEEMLPAVREEKCLEGTHVMPLVPSADYDPETPSTETSPVVTPPEQFGSARVEMISRETSRSMRLLEWFCGFKEGAQSSKENVVWEDARVIAERLYEPPRIKTLLNVGLLINLCLAIFMYVYFSL